MSLRSFDIRRALLGLTVLGLAACMPPSFDTDNPPEVQLGIDECDHCHMILSELRFAAVVSDPINQQHLRFDDLGCLADFLRAYPMDTSAAIWVSTEEGWLDADQAHYVLRPDSITPMGSGIEAYANAPLAQRTAESKGQVLSFTQLITEPLPAPSSTTHSQGAPT